MVFCVRPYVFLALALGFFAGSVDVAGVARFLAVAITLEADKESLFMVVMDVIVVVVVVVVVVNVFQ